MSHLTQFLRLLKGYVRDRWKIQMGKKDLGVTEKNCSRGKNVQKCTNNVEYTQTSLEKNLFEERLKKTLQSWAKQRINGAFVINVKQLHWEIYDLLGNNVLKPEILEKLMCDLISSNDILPVQLYSRLTDFYERWCQGEFIDAIPEDNLPQQKMLQLRSEVSTHQTGCYGYEQSRTLTKNLNIGLRQIDISAGLNVMILLFELHRIAQQKGEWKEKISFSPSGFRDTDNFFTSKLLRVINYSDTVAIGNFSTVVGEFLKGGSFSDAYLGDANLTGVNLSNANLSNSFLGDANLTAANLSGANFSGANLGDVNFSGADLSGANLRNADLSGATLSGANLNGADFSGADLSYADLSSAKLKNGILERANLTNSLLIDADLTSANLSHGVFFGANLSDTKLEQVNLSYSDLCRADLSGANLQGSNLLGSNLSDSILFGANLHNAALLAADLSHSKFNGAFLSGANLKGAILLGADLSGVDMSQVILNEADLSGVLLYEANLSGADMRDANLFGSDLSYTNLNNANLSGSNLSGVIFNGANLSHSNLSYAILEDIDLREANLEAMTWNENQQWRSVRGLEKAVNIPNGLRVHLKLG
ncbi:pentapeptide repeat-containing protein [Mastigocoleus testarum]|nr:pentapeptide repeat-containing protein [Mastigocoleus testarum]